MPTRCQAILMSEETTLTSAANTPTDAALPLLRVPPSMLSSLLTGLTVHATEERPGGGTRRYAAGAPLARASWNGCCHSPRARSLGRTPSPNQYASSRCG